MALSTNNILSLWYTAAFPWGTICYKGPIVPLGNSLNRHWLSRTCSSPGEQLQYQSVSYAIMARTTNIISLFFFGEQLLLYSTAFLFGTMRVEIYYTTKNPQFPWGTVTIDIDWQESIVPPGITDRSPGELYNSYWLARKYSSPGEQSHISICLLNHNGTIPQWSF